MPDVMALRGGTFWKCLGRDGEALVNEIGVFIREI